MLGLKVCTSIPMPNPQIVFVNLASNGFMFPSLNFERENALSMKKQNKKRIQGRQSWVLAGRCYCVSKVDVTMCLLVLIHGRQSWVLDCRRYCVSSGLYSGWTVLGVRW